MTRTNRPKEDIRPHAFPQVRIHQEVHICHSVPVVARRTLAHERSDPGKLRAGIDPTVLGYAKRDVSQGVFKHRLLHTLAAAVPAFEPFVQQAREASTLPEHIPDLKRGGDRPHLPDARDIDRPKQQGAAPLESGLQHENPTRDHPSDAALLAIRSVHLQDRGPAAAHEQATSLQLQTDRSS